MRDWKTTIPGTLAGIAQVAKVIFPEFSLIADAATGVFLAILGINSAQVKTPNAGRTTGGLKL